MSLCNTKVTLLVGGLSSESMQELKILSLAMLVLTKMKMWLTAIRYPKMARAENSISAHNNNSVFC